MRSLLLAASAVLLLTACESEQDRVARAAAQKVAEARVLGPDDLQITSGDRTVMLEVVGDSVFVLTRNSKVGAPATYIENLRYEGGRLRFDVKGIGLQMFDVGPEGTGAVFQPQEALAFVSVVLERQNRIEGR